MRYLSKRSGLQSAADWLRDRDQEAELRARIKATARNYLCDHQPAPGREGIVRRLDGVAGTIGGSLGVEVVFR